MTPSHSTYEVGDPELEEALRELARYIDAKLPPGLCFSLFLFTPEPAATFYIANAERASVIAALQEWIRNAKDRGY